MYSLEHMRKRIYSVMIYSSLLRHSGNIWFFRPKLHQLPDLNIETTPTTVENETSF